MYELVELEVGELPVDLQLASGPVWLDAFTPDCGPHHEDPAEVFARLERQDPSWSHSSTETTYYLRDEAFLRIGWWNERPTRMDIAISHSQICLTSLLDPELGVEGLETNCVCTDPILWSRHALSYSMFDGGGIELFTDEASTYVSIP